MTAPTLPPPPRVPAPSSFGGLLWTALLLAAAFLGARLTTQPPSALSTGAPEDVFSAGRAHAALARVLADELPHPVGSEEHAAVLERLREELLNLGLDPEIQSMVARGPDGHFARVRNVIVRLPGREPGPAVLLTGHYDSVAAGPGAGDDGASIGCMLEIARLLSTRPPLARDVLLLFSDAEEVGLVGAAAFAESPWLEEVGAVVNLEMRGTSGRSLLFETGRDSGPAIAAWGRSTRRPAATSLAAEVYRRMPNDTDFSVYRERGLPGANLAAIGNLSAYHGPLDNLAHLDLGTLQHHGDQALDLVRTLADGELPRAGDGDRVYVDILGRFLLGWPAGGSPWLALLATGLAVLTLWRLRKAQVLGLSEVFAGALGLVALVVIGAGLGALWPTALIALTGSELPWHVQPAPTHAGYAALALFSALAVARTVGRTAGFWGLWCAGLFLSSLLGLACAFLVPGVSFFFLIPALVGGLLPHVSTAMRSPLEARSREIALTLTVGASATLWLPIWIEIDLALTPGAGIVHGTLLVLVAALTAPLLAALRPRVSAALGTLALALVVGAGFWATRQAPYDAAHPQPLNLFYVGDGDTDVSRFAWWTPVDEVPDAARAALGPDAAPADLWGWAPRPMLVPTPHRDEDGEDEIEVEAAAAPTWGALAPVVELELNHSAKGLGADGSGDPDPVERGVRRLRARMRSLRWAEGIHICLPDGSVLEEVEIEGRTWDDFQPPGAGEDEELPPQLSFFGLGDTAIEVQWLQPADESFAVFDTSTRMPPSAETILAARGGDTAPIYAGDLSILFRRMRP